MHTTFCLDEYFEEYVSEIHCLRLFKITVYIFCYSLSGYNFLINDVDMTAILFFPDCVFNRIVNHLKYLRKSLL